MINKNLENIWGKINKKSSSECWEWAGGLRDGYGRIKINYKNYNAHRLVYELTYGLIPKGMCVLHKCDNRKCCNPEHLFLGTNNDNVKDKVSKNRQSHISINNGELCGTHKLITEQVVQIRLLYTTKKYSQRMLAKIYNVSQTTIWEILNNYTWKTV